MAKELSDREKAEILAFHAQAKSLSQTRDNFEARYGNFATEAVKQALAVPLHRRKEFVQQNLQEEEVPVESPSPKKEKEEAATITVAEKQRGFVSRLSQVTVRPMLLEYYQSFVDIGYDGDIGDWFEEIALNWNYLWRLGKLFQDRVEVLSRNESDPELWKRLCLATDAYLRILEEGELAEIKLDTGQDSGD